MAGFEFNELDLKGAFLIENFSVGDVRGRFCKCYERSVYEKAGISFSLSESFASVSMKNVVRGIHFQLKDPQAKLVCALKGRIWDVIVDLRPESKTYRRWVAEELSDENHRAFYIPRGFGHGFAALTDDVVMLYQCDGKYDPESDTGIMYDAPEIGIDWPIPKKDMILSERDKNQMSFHEFETRGWVGGSL